MKKICLIIVSLFTVLHAYSQDYFPMASGNTWNLHKFSASGAIQGYGSSSMTISSRTDFKAFEMVERTDKYDSKYDIYDNPENTNEIYVEFPSESIKMKLWRHRYKDKETWNSLVGTSISEYVGKVTVPAGTFDSCYQVRFVEKVDAWIFAPNVGIIKTIDSDGEYVLVSYKVSLTVPLAISYASNSKLKMYPNPFVSTVILDDVINVKKIELYDIAGNLVSSIVDPSSREQLNTSYLTAGVYFSNVHFVDNSVVTYRLLKQ
ncbi:MAG TPA: T9SS type A sorting domain-containing protein [Cytophagaceae bacterium]